MMWMTWLRQLTGMKSSSGRKCLLVFTMISWVSIVQAADGNTTTSNPINNSPTIPANATTPAVRDVSGCENSTLCGHGFCSERMGSYKCICLAGWTGDHCETNFDPCAASPCAGKSTNYCRKTDVGNYTCVCQPGFIDADGLCQKQVIWPVYSRSSGLNGVSGIYHSIPFTYFEAASPSLTAYSGDGFVTLGGDFDGRRGAPQTHWPSSPKLIGVYWSQFHVVYDGSQTDSYADFYSEDSRMDKNVSVENALVQYVKRTVGEPNFEPLVITVATWVNIRPEPYDKFPDEVATFQLIIATDSNITYAIRGYQRVWSNASGLPPVSTSYSLGGNQRTYSVLPKNVSGPEVIKLSTGEPNRNAFNCVEKTQTFLARYKTSVASLQICPCYQAQADLDELYKKTEPSCYQAASEGSTLTQQCCYNQYGILLDEPEEVKLPIPKDLSDTSLKSAHDQCCSDGSRLCRWFINQVGKGRCDKYIPPFFGAAFGDFHIVTFDKNKYSFFSVGDFVLFRSGNETVELHGRTALSSNNKTTLFVAFALKIDGNTTQIYISSNKLVVNGSVVDSDSLDVKYLDYTFKVRNNNGTLSVWIKSVKKDPDSRGLLGTADGSATNDFILGDVNMTLMAGTVSRLAIENITAFVESWRVEGGESLIDNTAVSTQTSLNYSGVILANTVQGVMWMFDKRNDTRGRYEAVQLCGNKLFCLQDFYREGNRESAWATLAEEDAITLRNDFLNALPQTSLGSSTLTYYRNIKYVRSLSSGPVYSMANNMWNVSGLTLDTVNAVLTWNMYQDTEVLRSLSYPRRIVFYVTDTRTNLTSVSSPRIDLCLCEKKDQCQAITALIMVGKFFASENGQSTGNVLSLECNCNGTASGRFCEQTLDRCDDCFNKNKSACNPTAVTNYCPPCPEGYVGDGFSCSDIDECADNNGGCQQECTNKVGGFTCSCWPGYSVSHSDTAKCDDVNECANINFCDNPLMFCVNQPGSAFCRCFPGLVGNTQCIRAPYSFPGSVGLVDGGDQIWTVSLLDDNSKEFIDLAARVADSVSDALERAGVEAKKNMYTEVLSFESAMTIVKSGRSKREVTNSNSGQQSYIVASFVIHVSNSSVTKEQIDAALRQYVMSGCTTFCTFGNVTLFYNSFPKMDAASDLCKYQEIHRCDSATTDCRSQDQITWCECKKGYIQLDTDVYSCHDFDECADKSTSYCAQTEKCINLAGSYMCECNQGTVWNATFMACAADNCSNNPCENDGVCHITDSGQGYVCSCTYGWNGPVCADEDTEAKRMKIAVICVSVILGVLCLALLITVVVLCTGNKWS